MKVIDLFSGIGGFSLGLESTGGFETVQFVENNEWCQKVLAKNFPNVPITGDIKNYEPKRSDGIGLVCGGAPCQPFSVAGKRKGTEDDRHLWPEMLRVIKISNPRWVIFENVRNITSIQEGMVLEQVCTDLENEGYEVQSFIIPASAVNAPHQRYRVWIVAHSDIRESRPTDESESRKEKQFESCANSTSQRGIVGYSKHNGLQDRCKEARGEKRESEQGRMLESERTSTQQNVAYSENRGREQTEWKRGQGFERGSYDSRGFERERQEVVTDVADSESNKQDGIPRETKSEHDKGNSWVESKCRSNRQSVGETKQDVADSEISDRYAHETDREHGETSSQEVFRNRSGIHRQTSWWSSEPNVGRVAHGISDRVDRLKGLGNAIVPQIAYQIGLAILEAEDEYTKVD